MKGVIIAWISRHDPTERQKAELARLFGTCTITRDIRPFSDAVQIRDRLRSIGAQECVVVAPLSVLHALTGLGLQPLRAEMRRVGTSDPDCETIVNGRGYAFERFVRVTGLVLTTEELTPTGPDCTAIKPAECPRNDPDNHGNERATQA